MAARAVMWSAGVTSSVVVPNLGALWAWQLQVPRSRALFIFTILWSVGTVLANQAPRPLKQYK